MRHSKNPIALITGASSGLGQAFAYALAKEGYDLILLARRMDRLQAIQAQAQTTCHCYAIDLTDTEALTHLLSKLPKHIDLLICNAGYRIKDAFEHADHTIVTHQIIAMIDSHNRLMQHYLKDFIHQGHGTILMVSSIAGLLSSPGPLYGPIKAYQHHQAINLHACYKHQGVHCMSLCPGLIRTEFHSANGLTDWSKIADRWWMSADVVATQTLKQLRKGRTFYIPGWYNRLLYTLLRHLPLRLQQKLAQRFFAKSKT